jgi:hypothetical protein
MEYYESGAVYLQGQFKNGVREGSWKEMSEAGKTTATVKYKDGKIASGAFTGMHPNPKPDQPKGNQPAPAPAPAPAHGPGDGHNH